MSKTVPGLKIQLPTLRLHLDVQQALKLEVSRTTPSDSLLKPLDFSVFQVLMSNTVISLVSQVTSATFVFSVTKPRFYYSRSPSSSPPVPRVPVFICFSFLLRVTACDDASDQKAQPTPPSPARVLTIFLNLAGAARLEGIRAAAQSLWEEAASSFGRR